MVRVLGWSCFALALIVLVADLLPALLGTGALRLRALGEWWFWLHPDSLQLLQPAVERHLSPDIWLAIQTVLEWKLALELLTLAGILLLISLAARRSRGRRKRLDFNKRGG